MSEKLVSSETCIYNEKHVQQAYSSKCAFAFRPMQYESVIREMWLQYH